MIASYLSDIKKELNSSEPDRHATHIDSIAQWIADEQKAGRKPNLNFICTHNSRRSQFAQTWCVMVQAWLDLDVANAYSGGTEVTACNERTVAALKRAGLSASSEGDTNPVYTITDPESGASIQLWSKTFDDQANPTDRFAAIMTCDHADDNCPFIPAAALRLPLTYTDPKFADDTGEEESAYDETCRMIATDMIRIFSRVKDRM